MKYGHILPLLFLLSLPLTVLGDPPVPAPVCPHPIPFPAPQSPHPIRLDAKQPTAAESALLQKKLAELDRLQKEVDALREATGSCSQILVKMQVLEVSLTKLNKLDCECAFVKNGKIETQRVSDFAALCESKCSIEQCSANSDTCGNKTSIAGFVDGLKKNNVAKVLTQPTLVVVSGRPAQFQVGGEIPVPVPESKDLKFITYGTQIDLTAQSLGNNKVRLHVRPRISELDTTHAVTVDGNHVPGVTVRQCDFCGETEFGKPIIVSGLVDQRTESYRTDDGVKSTVNEIQLAVIVTPEAVDSLPHEAEIPRLSKRGDVFVEEAKPTAVDSPRRERR